MKEKLLNNAGSISAEDSARKALFELEKYKREQNKKYISDFDKKIKEILNKKISK